MCIRDSCNVERIRELAPLVRCAMDENYFCVVGSSKEINKESELFDKIQPLKMCIRDRDDSVGENIVVEEFEKGYTYRDQVIRHSMVKVAN